MPNCVMMKKILIALSCIIVGLTACQKEPSFEDPNSIPAGGGGTIGTKLVRIGTRVGADSVTTDYTYTSANRLNSYSQSGVINGTFITADIRTVRNAASIITSTILKSNVLAQFGLDSIESFHTYDAANSRYKYSITSITVLGTTEVDSVIYNYDAAGKLVSAIDYYDDGSGSGYITYSKDEYTYSGTNLSEIRSYSYDEATSAYILEETVTREFDTKVNPLQFVADAPVLGMNIFYSANNPTKTTTIVTNPAGTTIRNIVYTYSSNNRPSTAVSSSGTASSTNTYYYQ